MYLYTPPYISTLRHISLHSASEMRDHTSDELGMYEHSEMYESHPDLRLSWFWYTTAPEPRSTRVTNMGIIDKAERACWAA